MEFVMNCMYFLSWMLMKINKCTLNYLITISFSKEVFVEKCLRYQPESVINPLMEAIILSNKLLQDKIFRDYVPVWGWLPLKFSWCPRTLLSFQGIPIVLESVYMQSVGYHLWLEFSIVPMMMMWIMDITNSVHYTHLGFSYLNLKWDKLD